MNKKNARIILITAQLDNPTEPWANTISTIESTYVNSINNRPNEQKAYKTDWIVNKWVCSNITGTNWTKRG